MQTDSLRRLHPLRRPLLAAAKKLTLTYHSPPTSHTHPRPNLPLQVLQVRHQRLHPGPLLGQRRRQPRARLAQAAADFPQHIAVHVPPALAAVAVGLGTIRVKVAPAPAPLVLLLIDPRLLVLVLWGGCTRMLE